MWSSNFTPRHTPGQNFHSKRYMHHYVHCRTIHISQNMKTPKCPLTDTWIKKIWYIYTMEYYSAIKKEQNNAICSTMDRTRDTHTKWHKSERERQMPHGITYTWNLIYDTNEPISRKETNSWTWRTDVWLPRGRGREWDRLGVGGWLMQDNALEKISNEI